jgi:hypothetical protein
LAGILESLPEGEIDRSHLHEIGAITEMTVFMETGRASCRRNGLGLAVA